MRPAGERSRRRLINLTLLAAGTASLVSGFLIQGCYHMQHGASDGRTVWGWDRPTWAAIHQLSSMVVLAFVAWHLWVNRTPLLAILKRPGAWRRQGPLLFAAFSIAVATALPAWTVGAVFSSHSTERALVEIHDKIVLPMSVLLLLHVWKRRSRLLPRG
jgi:hypothetical protein